MALNDMMAAYRYMHTIATMQTDCAMNFQRGFFRIWVILSVLWIIGFGSYVYGEIRSTYESSLKNEKISSEQSKLQTPDDDWFSKNTVPAEKVESASNLNTSSVIQNPPDKIVYYVGIAIFPPIFLLAFWFAGKWVINGFWSKKST